MQMRKMEQTNNERKKSIQNIMIMSEVGVYYARWSKLLSSVRRCIIII